MEEKELKEVDELLSKLQFQRTQDETPTWTRKEIAKSPGREIIVNGQRYTDPGQDVEINTKIEYWGTGSISDVFKSEQIKFFDFSFDVKEGEERHHDSMTFSVYSIPELEIAYREFIYRR